MGILGIGNKVFQISFHLIILLVLIVLFVLGYRYLAERFVDPLLEMDIAVKALAKGDLSVKVTYESDNELGRLSGSLRQTTNMLTALLKDVTRILEAFRQGDFNVRSEHPEAYIGDFRILLDGLVALVKGFSDTMRNIDNAADQVAEGSNDLAVSSQDLAQGATDQAASVEELIATVTEVTNQVQENTKTTDKAHDNAKLIGQQAKISQVKMRELTEAMETIKETFCDEIGKFPEVEKVLLTHAILNKVEIKGSNQNSTVISYSDFSLTDNIHPKTGRFPEYDNEIMISALL